MLRKPRTGAMGVRMLATRSATTGRSRGDRSAFGRGTDSVPPATHTRENAATIVGLAATRSRQGNGTAQARCTTC